MSEWKETDLGMVPIDWENKTVNDLVEEDIIEKPLDGNHGNIHPKGSDFVKKGIPFIMASDIKGGKVDVENCSFISEEQANTLQKGFSITNDVLLTHKATLGRTAIVGCLKTPYIMLTPQVTYYRVKDYNKLNNIYLKYYFSSSIFQGVLENHGNSGSTRSYVGITAQRELPILLPPINVQEDIAKVLSSLDDKVDLLQRQNATLESIAETLFREWFILKAKKDWEEKPLSSIAKFLNGLACQKYPPKNDLEKLPVLKIKELSAGFSENSDWATTDVKDEYIVENGDVIFAWSASLMVKIWTGDKCILNQHLFKVSSHDFPKWFYYLWCKHHLVEFISIAESHATTMGHIKRKDLDEAIVLVPTPNEIEEMNNIISPIITKIIQNNKQIQTLTKLRDTLLPKLMSGEVGVKI
ncbi:MAG TPA: restriction endonuclease subunit S [Dysgonomonas sp.]|uniref:restriction endonuclease subunit S n=1 Tax=unclassified Dysgonomonas TaxID=2630389 RepID=UPI0025BB27A5|nr:MULTISPECIES: restriction endonuclease subunit S [unclassified Dysgonomonas]HML64952.1 restriction endonuclease subunit S [Dysgonomonas sp.]